MYVYVHYMYINLPMNMCSTSRTRFDMSCTGGDMSCACTCTHPGRHARTRCDGETDAVDGRQTSVQLAQSTQHHRLRLAQLRDVRRLDQLTHHSDVIVFQRLSRKWGGVRATSRCVLREAVGTVSSRGLWRVANRCVLHVTRNPRIFPSRSLSLRCLLCPHFL